MKSNVITTGLTRSLPNLETLIASIEANTQANQEPLSDGIGLAVA